MFFFVFFFKRDAVSVSLSCSRLLADLFAQTHKVPQVRFPLCLFSQQSCKLVVDGVSWFGGNNVTLDWFAYKRYVANNIQKFVSGRFIVPYERLVLDVAQFSSIVPFGLGQFA